MSRKKRVLAVGEFSGLATGYGTYYKNILTKLYETGKYELAELAALCAPDDPRQCDVPWEVFPVIPASGDEEGRAAYETEPGGRFGAWCFEDVAARYRPDIVMTIRDPWMDQFVADSPHRRHFHWAWMATLDGEPQEDGWLDLYQQADSLLGYTQWGLDVVNKQAGGTVNYAGVAPPGADLAVFRPGRKAAARKAAGVPEDCHIILTTMRNQPRKLYPDLLEAFATYLREAPPGLAAKTLLWLHTGYPDFGGQGWNIPALVREFGVGGRVLLTYTCTACEAWYADFYHDVKALCRACKEQTAQITDSNHGVSREALATIYNTADLYVQYSVCEGYGMPQVEAAACGVPVASVDYSAMAEVVRGVGGYPIPVQRFVRDPFSGRRFAYPDNAALVRHMIDFLGRPAPLRARAGRVAREGVLAHFTYERSAKVWEAVIDAAPFSETWGEPPRLLTPPKSVPEGLGDEQFASWCISHVAGRPGRAHSYPAVRLARELAWGPGKGGTTRADAVDRMTAERHRWNHFEQKRGGR